MTKHLTLPIVILSFFSCENVGYIAESRISITSDGHFLYGNWTAIDYCVYNNNNCTGDCHNQEFLPIIFVDQALSMISTIRDLEIDYDGNTSGYGNISFIGGEFISRTTTYTVGSDWGTGTVGGSVIFSGDYFVNENIDTLQLIYSDSGECIRQEIDNGGWTIYDGFDLFRYHRKMTNDDSTECYDYFEVDDYNDTTNFVETWYPAYCAKLTFYKQ